MATPNIESVIEGYLLLRRQKEEVAKRHKEEMAPFGDKMEKLENFLQHHLMSLGLTSVASKGVGTAFLETRTDASVEDWDATFDWIKKSGAWEFLERRVSKTVVKDYMEAHGDVPPGIKVTREMVVRVRTG